MPKSSLPAYKSWNHDRTLKLIECYRKHPNLWDTRHRTHLNKTARERSWRNIAQDMQISVNDCRAKVTTILSSMRRERSKIRKHAEAGTCHVPTWFAYEKLLFLYQRRVKPKPTNNNQIVLSVREPRVSAPDAVVTVEDCTSSAIVACQKRYRPTFRDAETLTHDVLVSCDKTTSTEDGRQDRPADVEKDASAMFCDLLAFKLRDFQEPLRDVVMNEIDNFLFRAKMELNMKRMSPRNLLPGNSSADPYVRCPGADQGEDIEILSFP